MSRGSSGEFLNVRDTAELLGVHENTVRAMSDRGELTPHFPSGPAARRFRRVEVLALLRRQMVDDVASAAGVFEATESLLRVGEMAMRLAVAWDQFWVAVRELEAERLGSIEVPDSRPETAAGSNPTVV